MGGLLHNLLPRTDIDVERVRRHLFPVSVPYLDACQAVDLAGGDHVVGKSHGDVLGSRAAPLPAVCMLTPSRRAPVAARSHGSSRRA